MTVNPPRASLLAPTSEPQDLALLRGLAGLHFNYGQYKAAESLLDLALWLDPSDKSSHALMSRILMRQQRGVQAKEHLDKARRAKRAR